MIDIPGLHRLLSGWTVESVRPVEGDPSLCEIHLRRGPEERLLHLHGNRLSAWFVEPKGGAPPEGTTYGSVEEMARTISEHLLSLPVSALDFRRPLEYVTDGPRRLFGFQCRATRQAWWVTALAVKESPYSGIFRPAQRERVDELLIMLDPWEALQQLAEEP